MGMDSISGSDIINFLGVSLRFLTLVFSLVFCIRYSRLNWRSLPEGRHLMGFSFVIFLFMVWSFINNWMAWRDPTPPEIRPDGDWPGREVVAVILFGFTAWYMLQRNLLLTPQRLEREAKEAEDALHDDRAAGISVASGPRDDDTEGDADDELPGQDPSRR